MLLPVSTLIFLPLITLGIFLSVITGTRSSVEISGPYKTFGLAKKALWEIYNKLMWQGTICAWNNNISFTGIVEGISTTVYIKKD